MKYIPAAVFRVLDHLAADGRHDAEHFGGVVGRNARAILHSVSDKIIKWAIKFTTTTKTTTNMLSHNSLTQVKTACDGYIQG